jgi:hypothetical protein
MLPYNAPPIVQQDGQFIKRKSDKTGLISWVSNKYSVPMSYQGGVVGVIEEDNDIVIYDIATQAEIARHSKAQGKGHVIQNRNHYRDLNQLVSDLEAKIIELLGDESGAKLCFLLKTTSPLIYKDQLRGVIKILSCASEPLNKEVIDTLCQRQCLTAKSIKEYLEVFITKQKASIKEDTIIKSEHSELTLQLARYKKVLPDLGGNYAIH